MSMLKSYDKVMTPTRVKSTERNDVDINKLVKHGAAGIVPRTPVYADLTGLPASRGEAAHRILSLTSEIPPEAAQALLSLGPDQALEYLKNLQPPATKRNDLNDAKRAGSESSDKSSTPASKADPVKAAV